MKKILLILICLFVSFELSSKDFLIMGDEEKEFKNKVFFKSNISEKYGD